MPSLETLQFRLAKALRSDLRDTHAISTLELDILQHQETRLLVRQRAAERRGLKAVPDFDPDHIPGVLRKHNIIRNGKQRTVFTPENLDYCQSQYYQRGIIGYVADDTVHENTYAYIEGRGIDDAISEAIDITIGRQDCVWDQEDISHCFNTVPTGLAEPAFPPRAWNHIEQVRHRFRELTHDNGLPQGHPVAASVTNVVINMLLGQIRLAYQGRVTIIVYSDDLTIIGPHATTKQVRAEIQAVLATHGMKLNPGKSRIARPVQGLTITLLGYEIEWLTPHSRPLIRPRRKAYSGLEESLANALDLNHAGAIERGWRNAYRLTNDPSHPARMQLAIKCGTDRWHATTHRTNGPNNGGHR